jgi:hypothetical protein
MSKEKNLSIEEASLQSAANFGIPEAMYMPDPDTGEYVFIDFANPTPEAKECLRKIVAIMEKYNA